MKTEIRTITPAIAKEILKRNPNNRKLSDGHVSFLSNEMKKGNWMFDGQPIRLSESGSLLDGQHRLNAVVSSGITIDFLVVSGIETKAFKVMDTGKNRNASDVFSIEGIDYPNECAAASRIIIRFKKGNTANESGNNKLSNTDLLNFMKNNIRIVEFAKTGSKLAKEFDRILSASQIAAYSYLMAEKNIVQSEIFWTKLSTGLDLEANDPIYVLRKKLIQDKMSNLKIQRVEKEGLIIKAWNHYRKGTKIKYLKIQSDEKFSKII